MPFIPVDKIVHYYTIEGAEDAPALVFANSLGSDHRIWDPVLPHLKDKFRIIRYDQRGHGLSNATPPPYSIDDLVNDLAGLLAGLKIDNAVFCGLSVGGMIAQGLAACYPERARALILCDTAMQIGPPSMWDERIAVIQKGGVGVLTEPIMERWFTLAFRESRAAEFSGYINMLERTPVEGYIGTCCAIRDADLREAATSIDRPTLVLCGDQDMATPPELAGKLADAITGAKFTLIENAAHISCVEQPEIFSRLLLDFVEGISSA
ncbi:Beta-ketoadipate enol-lactone hydrolase (EC [Olavius sp. associated proteobacterium Delta 1]|nr:Beta-ketoadipate enol-lactone hydrolase (EC [Olavius sp. associated proteobacterium Delta 1]